MLISEVDYFLSLLYLLVFDAVCSIGLPKKSRRDVQIGELSMEHARSLFQ